MKMHPNTCGTCYFCGVNPFATQNLFGTAKTSYRCQRELYPGPKKNPIYDTCEFYRPDPKKIEAAEKGDVEF